MSCTEELSALADEDLLDFILKDDAPCPDILEENNSLLEDWGVPEFELLDKEVDDFISSLLSPFEEEPGIVQGYLPAGNDSGISEGQHLSHSPGSDVVSSPWSSDIVQVDHNYHLHRDWPVLESMRSDTAERHFSIDLETWMGLEGTSKALEESFTFPIAIAVDAGPQLVPGAIVQSNFPELVLKEEERQLMEKESVSLPTGGPMNKAEGCLPKKVRRKIRNKKSAQDSRRRKKIYVDGLENRLAVCTAQNHKLRKKVQLLEKQNMSLLKELQKLQALVRLSTTRTTTTRTCTMVMLLSCLVLSPSSCSTGRREPQPELRMLSQQIREISTADVQKDAVVEGFSPEPVDCSLLGSLHQSWEEDQSLPNHDPRSYFNSNSSSDLPVSELSELGPPQPLEQGSQSDPLQSEVPAVCKPKRQSVTLPALSSSSTLLMKRDRRRRRLGVTAGTLPGRSKQYRINR